MNLGAGTALPGSAHPGDTFFLETDANEYIYLGGAWHVVGGPPPSQTQNASVATRASVAQNAASVQLLAANPRRIGAIVFNDSTANLLVGMGAGASTTDFSYKIAAGGTLELPEDYVGIVSGIWDAAGAGNARVTELAQ